jgi:hypothetical protein
MCWKFGPHYGHGVEEMEPLRGGAYWKLVRSWGRHPHQWINTGSRVEQVS